MRAKVTKVVDRNTVFCQIGQPMTRGHNFRNGDLVACRRTPGILGETWQAVENRPAALPPVLAPAKAGEPAAKKMKR